MKHVHKGAGKNQQLQTFKGVASVKLYCRCARQPDKSNFWQRTMVISPEAIGQLGVDIMKQEQLESLSTLYTPTTLLSHLVSSFCWSLQLASTGLGLVTYHLTIPKYFTRS